MKHGLCIFLIAALATGLAGSAASVSFAQDFSWQATPIACEGADCPDVASIAVNSRDVVFAGLAGESVSVSRSTDAGLTWTSLEGLPPGGPGISLALNGSDHLFAGTSLGVFRSTDDGETWAQVLDVPGLLSMYVDSTDVVYAGGADGDIHRSKDGGDTWDRTSTHLAVGIRAIISGRNGQVFACSDQGGIYRNSGYSSVWQAAGEGQNVYSLAVDASGNIYAGLGSGAILLTTNSGSNWIELNAGGFASPMRALAVNGSGHLFAGTAMDGALGGIIRSTDGGGSWPQYNDGIPAGSGAVHAIAFTSAGTGLAGVGGTLYRTSGPTTAVPENGSAVPSRAGLLGNYPNPFNPSTTVRFELDRAEYVRLEIFDIFGRNVATLVDGMTAPGSHSESWSAGDMAGGTYFVRFTAGDATGIGRLLLVK